MNRRERILTIFFRAFRGEALSKEKLADEYNVSQKGILRDMNEIRNFISNNKTYFGNTEFKYSRKLKAHVMNFDNALSTKELVAISKVLIASRAFNERELAEVIQKIKRYTTQNDRALLDEVLRKEMFCYRGVLHKCEDVMDLVWQLTNIIHKQKEISIVYYKMDGSEVNRRLKPVSILFSEYYFYLIAYHAEDETFMPRYYRVDRIVKITEHRESFYLSESNRFNEGELRNKIQFMFPGKERRIRFLFTGPSMQAVLDRLPTARILERCDDGNIIEAKVFGRGINMFLLSQGSWVKALGPPEFVEEMRQEIDRMKQLYM